ncbi:MAG: 4Fe-4S binding protein [Dissulfurispiraceae bacterium]|jgi:NAD-dependent dihydropyrimidine dehydrogenase PreA subunit
MEKPGGVAAMYMVSVNVEKCEGCEECVNVCPQAVFRMVDSKSDPYQTGECVFCESCLGVCPTSAITINEM